MQLTEIEIAILYMIADEELTNAQIAKRRKTTERAVEEHLVNINRKLGTKSRTGAVIQAVLRGILQQDKLSLKKPNLISTPAPRELECLWHRRKGRSPQETARIMSISVGTVSSSLNKAKDKLGVKSVDIAAQLAEHFGLFKSFQK